MNLSILLVLLSAPLTGPEDDHPPLVIAGHAYEKLESRQATLDRMIDLLTPEKGTWGDWHLLSPFPYKGHGQRDLYTRHAPEDELDRLRANDPGPDFSRSYTGKNGAPAAWSRVDGVPGRRVDLRVHADNALNDDAVCYLHTTVTTAEARTVEVWMGSDDGVLVWLNGRLVLERDLPRGMNPYDDLLRLDLEAGTNHVVFKVDQGMGGWDFQIETRESLSSAADAHLYYQLDRDFPPSRERHHYRVLTFPVPEDSVLEVGGLAFYGDDARPVVSTRRGDVFLMNGAYSEPPLDVEYVTFARGLHEALGAGVRKDADGEAIYVTQRGEVTRLLDDDGDDHADRYETFNDDWGVSGNYHEFAFGPKFDREGNAWVSLNVGFCGSLGKAIVPNRGAALKIDRKGNATWICDGLRSPNGMAEWTDGTMFYVDNQGDYVATNRLSELKQDAWHGHPASLRWRTDLRTPDERPPRQPPTIWFPYQKMGQSAADVALDDTDGKFGPFAGQLFVGDQLAATVMRVALEKVDGHYQGACFPFLSGLGCGVNRVAFAPDGSMFVGETDRGWASVGRKRYGVERIVHTGVTPFEILTMNATKDGFALTFTADVDPAAAASPSSYRMTSYTYEYHSDYGAPEDDTKPLAIRNVVVSGPRTVRLVVDPLRAGYVHELHADGVRSAAGDPLLHTAAYYTLVRIPGRRDDATARKKVLFVTHSAGFVHDVVRRPRPHVYSPAEERLIEAARDRFDVTATQSVDALARANLAEPDAIVFYTTGELPFDDGSPSALLEWIRRGGAFIGVHSATDTLYESPEYLDMIGGTFDGHPWNQEVGVIVEDPAHPAVRHLGARFAIHDEIYQFRDFQRHPLHVLLRLDPTSVDATKGKRADQDYAISWCKEYGEGRVFYTSLGHRLEVWKDARFQRHLLDGIEWAIDGPDHPVALPAGARVLFSGTDLQSWQVRDGGEATWTLVDGAMEVARGAGDIVTRETFGDFLLHLEFQTPRSRKDATGQARGNSGVYVHDRYEVQVLDSYGVDPLGLGDCGAIYGKRPAAANASRPPERWQTYDVRFRAPRFDSTGAKNENARISVWWNGVTVQDDVEIDGPTGGAAGSGEVPRGPIRLQDHGDPVRYRNVWIVAEDRSTSVGRHDDR